MEYRHLGNSNIEVSRLALGTMMYGTQISEADAHRQLDIAIEHGVNLIDTAEMYPVPPDSQTQGRSESIIGAWLAARGRRADVVIATKATGPGIHVNYIRDGKSRHDAQHLTRALDESLKRLNTDYVDLYQLHWPVRPTNTFGQLGYKPAQIESPTNLEESLRALDQLVRAGKVRTIGLSNETPWGLMSFLSLANQAGLSRVVAIQNPYNLLNRTFEIGLGEIAHRENVGLVAYSPLGFGVLSGKYTNGARPDGARLTRYQRFVRYNKPEGIAAAEQYVSLARNFEIAPEHMAIGFVLTRPYVTSVVIGASTTAQLLHNLEAISHPVSKQLLKAIDKIHTQIPNPCP